MWRRSGHPRARSASGEFGCRRRLSRKLSVCPNEMNHPMNEGHLEGVPCSGRGIRERSLRFGSVFKSVFKRYFTLAVYLFWLFFRACVEAKPGLPSNLRLVGIWALATGSISVVLIVFFRRAKYSSTAREILVSKNLGKELYWMAAFLVFGPLFATLIYAGIRLPGWYTVAGGLSLTCMIRGAVAFARTTPAEVDKG